MKCAHLTLALFFVLLCGCGEKTKSDLINVAVIHKVYDVDSGYQRVHLMIGEKFVECRSAVFNYMKGNIYNDLGFSEYYLNGVDGAGYAFLIHIKDSGNGKTRVDVYSKISTGYFKEFPDIVEYGVRAMDGCP